MKKIFIDCIIVGAVIFAYVFLAAVQPGINDIIASANSSGNWTHFKDAQAVVNSFPIYMWFIPGLCGLVLIVVNHVATDS